MNTQFRHIFLLLICYGFINSSLQAQAQKTPRNRWAINSSDTTELLMNEHRFWGLMQEARAVSGGSYIKQTDALKRLLFTLEPSEIEQFDNRFSALMDQATEWKIWGAAFVIKSGCREDCFEFFRQYLIAHGRDKYYAALRDPESCSNWIKPGKEAWDGIFYVAPEVYKMKTGFEIPASYQPSYELRGEPFDEKLVTRDYPQLSKRFSAKNR
jgi:hypothetical protein